MTGVERNCIDHLCGELVDGYYNGSTVWNKYEDVLQIMPTMNYIYFIIINIYNIHI